MNENLLHFVWQTRRFDQSNLMTTLEEHLEIIYPGEYNTDAGADFQNARLKIDDTLWIGNVEIHLKASDWYRHGHQNDPAYANVILHVVMEEDKQIENSKGQLVPCLVMKNRIPGIIINSYQRLMASGQWIPCQASFQDVQEVIKSMWLERLVIERLEKKSNSVMIGLQQNSNNWEETFYQFMAKGFGLKINAEPFEQMARSMPLQILSRNRDRLFTIEALLFGVSGFLEQVFSDDYPKQLRNEFVLLKRKYKLTPIPLVSWKFLRLHPGNFPTIRISQFAALILKSSNLFSKVLETNNFGELKELLKVKASDYWQTHYRFDKLSKASDKVIGDSTIEAIAINTIIPFLFAYGKTLCDESIKARAVTLLESIKAEDNKILKGWDKLGMKAKNAAQSQSLLQLKNEYCDRKKCLHCAIGAAIMRE
jgi:hypothetical protein